MILFHLEPWDIWPRKRIESHQRPFSSPFRAPYPRTCDQLIDELERLKVAEAVIQLKGVTRGGFYRSGLPMESLRTESEPGVILSFTRAGKPLSLPCDRFRTWQDNLRAITLALEHLRGADRYGVTQAGEQYRGWEALPPPGPQEVVRDRAWALDLIARLSGLAQDQILKQPIMREAAIKQARVNAHPDKGGKPSDALDVGAAAEILKQEVA